MLNTPQAGMHVWSIMHESCNHNIEHECEARGLNAVTYMQVHCPYLRVCNYYHSINWNIF